MQADTHAGKGSLLGMGGMEGTPFGFGLTWPPRLTQRSTSGSGLAVMPISNGCATATVAQ